MESRWFLVVKSLVLPTTLDLMNHQSTCFHELVTQALQCRVYQENGLIGFRALKWHR